MAYVTGRLEIYINQKLMFTKSGAKASGIGRSGSDSKGPPVKRKAVMADSGVVGYVEEVIPARCEITLIDTDAQELTILTKINGDGEVIFQRAGDKGKQYTLINATNLGDLGLTGGEGDTDVIFEGHHWEERIRS